MAERDLIRFIEELTCGTEPRWLTVGIGDDAAVLQPPAGRELVLTTDSVVEGVHFKPPVGCEQVGRKAVARSLSDLAAMAAEPLCTLAAVDLGISTGEEDARSLVRSIRDSASAFRAPLVGGDISSNPGPLTVNVTCLGTVRPGRAVTRAGARPGDCVCVTGSLGGSMLGRHLTFEPRVEAALKLDAICELHAMIDLSDGLSTDALHVAEESKRGICLRAADIPVSQDAHVLSAQTGRDAVWHALNDGEDYELLFCLPRQQAKALVRQGVAGLPVSLIGQVTNGTESYIVMPDGRRETLQPGGWEHEIQ